MKNTLADLNNHLFEQLERLNDEDLQGLRLKEEIERARAVAKIAEKIIDNGELVLEAVKLQKEYGDNSEEMPKMLKGDKK